MVQLTRRSHHRSPHDCQNANIILDSLERLDIRLYNNHAVYKI